MKVKLIDEGKKQTGEIKKHKIRPIVKKRYTIYDKMKFGEFLFICKCLMDTEKTKITNKKHTNKKTATFPKDLCLYFAGIKSVKLATRLQTM